MTTLPSPSLLEVVAAHPATSAAIAAGSTAAATLAAGPATAGGLMMAAAFAMVPVLWDSSARRASEERIQTAIREIQQELAGKPEHVKNLSDQQLGFIAETIVSLAGTYDAGKIDYLKNAVLSAALDPSLVLENSGFLARILRDITAHEMNFIVVNFGTRLAVLAPEAETRPDDALVIERGSTDEGMVAGLTSLGLVFTSSSGPFDFDYYDWTRLAGKLLTLIQSKPAP